MADWDEPGEYLEWILCMLEEEIHLAYPIGVRKCKVMQTVLRLMLNQPDYAQAIIIASGYVRICQLSLKKHHL